MVATLEQHTVLPPDDGGAEIQRLASALAEGPAEVQATLIGPDGAALALPAELYHVLADVASALSQGLAVTIAPQHAVLTTQQAAEMLNISRPTLVKLLEDGEIAYEQRGRHRHVRLGDVVEYQQRSRRERRDKLTELTRTAEQDGTADTVDEFVQTR